MKRVLVTGATGNVGRQVVSQLLATDCPVRAMTRNRDAAGLPLRVDVVCAATPTDADALGRCLDGVDVVFSSWTGARRAMPAAVSTIVGHARRVVLLTAPHKTPHPFFQQPNPVQRLFAQLERLIEESGLQSRSRRGRRYESCLSRPKPSGCCWMRGQPHSVSLPTSRPRSRRSPGGRPVDSAAG